MSNIQPHLVHLTLTLCELGTIIAGLRAIGALTLAARLDRLLRTE